MQEVFRDLLEASLSGSVVILAVIILRLVLKKAPRSVFCLLWLLAGLRLVLPFEIESSFSLQPRIEPIALEQPVTLEVPEFIPVSTLPAQEILPEDTDTVKEDAQIPEVPEMENTSFLYGVSDGKIRLLNYGDIASWVWLVGVAALAGMGLLSYWKLKGKVREAWLLDNGCWECPGIDTAFVLGFLPPKIYLPSGLSEEDRDFICSHENTHIARHDHWWKFVGYGVLALHWFNPMVWIAYSLLCKDIELACDEHVVKYMSVEQRKAYSAALLSCSSKHARFAACPVAFGESDPRQRILSVLNYKRPGFWISVAAIAAVVFVAVCLMTSPTVKEPDPSFLNYKNAVSLVADREIVIALHHHTDVSGGILSICKADGGEVEAYLEDASWQDWLVSDSHGGFDAYIDFLIDEDYSLRIFDNGHADAIYGGETRHYRIPKADYEHLKTILSYADEEDVRAAAAEYVLNWGITLYAEYVTPSGITLVCTQDGTAVSGELMTERLFWLEQRTEAGWTTVPTLVEDVTWTTEGLMIPIGETVRWNVDWSYLYGELPNGTYRICKTVTHRNAPRDYVDYTYYAEFEIAGTEDVWLTKCRDALEQFQAQEVYGLVIDRQFSGPDALNDGSTQIWYGSGTDWLRQSLVSGMEPSAEEWHLVKDGKKFSRYIYTFDNPAHGESSDTGWVESFQDGEGQINEPWLRTFDWDDHEITFVEHKMEGGTELITFIVQGSPHNDEYVDVLQYQVTFVFNGNSELQKVLKNYTQTWPMFSNGEETMGIMQVSATISLHMDVPEEITAMIDATYLEAAASQA